MPNEELFLGVLCSLCALRAEQPVRELTTQAVPFTSSVIPLFRHGYLILFPPGGANGTPLVDNVRFYCL